MIKDTLPLCKILLKILKNKMSFSNMLVILMGDELSVSERLTLWCGSPELLVEQEWL